MWKINNEPYLAHHGIKGQKWGIRRYQNPDGSLTREGYLRYGIDQREGKGNQLTERTLGLNAREKRNLLYKRIGTTTENIMEEAAKEWRSANGTDDEGEAINAKIEQMHQQAKNYVDRLIDIEFGEGTIKKLERQDKNKKIVDKIIGASIGVAVVGSAIAVGSAINKKSNKKP